MVLVHLLAVYIKDINTYHLHLLAVYVKDINTYHLMENTSILSGRNQE